MKVLHIQVFTRAVSKLLMKMLVEVVPLNSGECVT